MALIGLDGGYLQVNGSLPQIIGFSSAKLLA
jgi:hypothetical protein